MVPSFTKSKKTLKTTFTKTSVIFKIILCSIIFSETTAVAVTLTSDGVSQTLVLPLSSNKSNLVFLRNIKHAPGTLWRLWGYHPCTFRALMYIYPCLFLKKTGNIFPKKGRSVCVSAHLHISPPLPPAASSPQTAAAGWAPPAPSGTGSPAHFETQ